MERVKKILLRKQVGIIVLILLVGLCCWYFYRDLRLDVTTKFTKLPDVVIQDVKVDKIINGRKWKIYAPSIKTEDNVVYGDNIDLTINEKDGTESHITAKKAVFSRDYEQLSLTNAKGSMNSGRKKYALKTGKAEYDAKTEVWSLNDKLSITDHDITVTGYSGSFDSRKGLCKVRGGGKISW